MVIDSHLPQSINHTMLYENIREESLKLKVAADWFPKFDCTDLIGRIDFAVKCKEAARHVSTDTEYILWAEAKQQPTDIYRMLAQLIITIKADAFDRVPPKFIGCFDNEKIAFIEYHYALHIYQINDFNWTQTPSAVDDKTVETVRNAIDPNRVFTFYFDSDSLELKNFIKANFAIDGGSMLATLIDKNNFIFVYQKWQKMVMPYIAADWEKLKKNYSIYDRDFFLAELNVDDNGTPDVSDDKTVNSNFYITFDASADKPYQLKRTDNLGTEFIIPFGFKSVGIQHYTDFWKRYHRPPHNDYWNYIVERADLLVPQDVRERKGAYFTPQIWVEKSQQYIADVLGDNWQDEYYVWDCCAGTGNLLNGLTNKYNVWASTLDQQDVDVMKERIRNGANLLENHVFQFDFLNDDFSKCPQGLQDIINDPAKRRKLVIYINPPYAEAGSGQGKHKAGVATENKTFAKYKDIIGKACNEVYTQIFTRVYKEIPNCTLAAFSTLTLLTGGNFDVFRKQFLARLESLFIVPAKTFDNVKGLFPIGFFIWNTKEKVKFVNIIADVFDSDCFPLPHKNIQIEENNKTRINNWLSTFNDRNTNSIGVLMADSPDFQNNQYISILNEKGTRHGIYNSISTTNLINACVYFAVRHVIEHSWLNHNDQFSYPNDHWSADILFQTNCLIYALFHGKNRISVGSVETVCTPSQQTKQQPRFVNHWIPFTETEVDAKDRFESHFMSDFLAGKIKPTQSNEGNLFESSTPDITSAPQLQFTAESNAVLGAGRELWRYYHTMHDANPNASLYDIKEYFQGRNDKGKMNPSSEDAHYTELLDNLKSALKALGEQIKPKVYEYGFLR